MLESILDLVLEADLHIPCGLQLGRANAQGVIVGCFNLGLRFMSRMASRTSAIIEKQRGFSHSLDP